MSTGQLENNRFEFEVRERLVSVEGRLSQMASAIEVQREFHVLKLAQNNMEQAVRSLAESNELLTNRLNLLFTHHDEFLKQQAENDRRETDAKVKELQERGSRRIKLALAIIGGVSTAVGLLSAAQQLINNWIIHAGR